MGEDCVFCKIVAGEIPADRVYEDELAVAFKDLNPSAPHHVLIVPREHTASVNEVAEDNRAVIGRLLMAAGKAAQKLGIDQSGYRCVINTNQDAGQEVFHVHVHMLGGRKFGWPPG